MDRETIIEIVASRMIEGVQELIKQMETAGLDPQVVREGCKVALERLADPTQQTH